MITHTIPDCTRFMKSKGYDCDVIAISTSFIGRDTMVTLGLAAKHPHYPKSYTVPLKELLDWLGACNYLYIGQI